MEQSAKIYSIYEDVFLVEKLQKELKKIEQQLCVEDILDRINIICTYCRSNGYKALMELYEETDNNLLKDMFFLLSKVDNRDEICYVIYLLKPRLYSYKLEGQEYVESVIYFEALLMILEGEVPELVRLRTINMLAIEERAKDILS